MAKRHNDDGAEKDETTDQSIDNEELTGAEAGGSSRRSVLKGAATAAATLGTVGVLSGGAAAQSTFTESPSGEVVVDPGEYTWGGGSMDIGSGDALVGGGEPGDVVVNLDRTMSGSVSGRLENVVLRGENPSPKAGLDLHPGATVDGFIWPEGGNQSEDRALYTPDGGDDRLTLRNSAWAWMGNNGAYIDKPPVTVENCAAVNNNIAGIRVGHRDGTSSGQTSYIRNSLVAVTADIRNDGGNSANARGLRVRRPGHIVIENCYFIYLDVDGAANPIELHDGAAGASVEIRNCAFYNDTGNALVRDKSGGEIDVTVENCVAVGSGSFEFEAGDVSESDLAADGDVSFPLPSDLTGYAAADEIEGVDPNLGPWNGSVQVDDGSEQPEEPEHTLVMHASPDNPDADLDVSFVVDGTVEYGEEADEDTDLIEENGDGTTTVTSVGLAPDSLDSFNYSGDIVDYDVPEGYEVDVSIDGTTRSFEEIVGQVFEVVSQSTNTFTYEFEVDGDVEMVDLSDQITTGNRDEIDASGETTLVTGFTGNTGYGDAYRVYGEILRFEITDGNAEYVLRLDGEEVSFDGTGGDQGSDDGQTDDGQTDDGQTDDGQTDDGQTDDGQSGGGDATPHQIVVQGNGSATQYTFTVSGDVVRDEAASEVTDDSMTVDQVQDIAREGKVIGVVGTGVDAYRFSGNLTAFTVDGDADVDITKDA